MRAHLSFADLADAWRENLFARAIVYLVMLLVAAIAGAAHAEAIPPQAKAWRLPLTAFARADWGASAPVATFAAQVHQESAWRVEAQSRAGARGLAQFMPATATWISTAFPSELAPADPGDPLWSLRALVKYDRWIHERVSGSGPCDRVAATLASYNAGLGWVLRAQAMAGTVQWLGAAERVNPGQSTAAFRESRAYPRRILGQLEPLYSSWGPRSC